MKRFIPIAVIGVICAVGMAWNIQSSDCCPLVVQVTMKTYQATVTTKDNRNNTKTFTATCQAESTSAAQRQFEAQYPNATISGVREVNSK